MWQNPQETANLFTFTEQILYRKLHFLYSVFSILDLFQMWAAQTNAQSLISFHFSLFFLQNKALYKQNFLEYTF